MKMNKIYSPNHLLQLCTVAFLLTMVVSCDKDSVASTNEPDYVDTIYDERKVMILYSAGHNTLSSYLQADIKELVAYSDLHSNDENADAILIFTHSYSNSACPCLIHPYFDEHGNTVMDTLVTYDSSTISASAQTLNTVLTYVKENFPADEYGLVFSSHGRGYLPAGYYDYASTYESSYSASSSTAIQRAFGIHRDPEPVASPDYPEIPLVKGIGVDTYNGTEYEMEIADFAEAIPMDLEYIVFDACLMGGIETAYQLRDKTRWLIASPTEILADGMDYTTMAAHLMAHPTGDFEAFCENYYNYYNSLSGSYQSASVSLTDCTQLDALATICASLFSTYRDAIDNMDYSDVQKYFTSSHHWFYDIGDIIEHLGCTDEELEAFNDAMDACICYKAATESFLGSFTITNFSGLSMMLPCYAGAYLKSFYTTLDWNKATALVE